MPIQFMLTSGAIYSAHYQMKESETPESILRHIKEIAWHNSGWYTFVDGAGNTIAVSMDNVASIVIGDKDNPLKRG